MKNIHFFLVLLCITLTGYRASAQCDSLIGTTQIMNGLPNGTYKVVVTGANGCTAEAYREVSTYNDLYVTIYNNQDNSCNTTNAGQLEAYVSSGTGPYTYQWSNGQTTSTISNLANGTYTVTVTGANSCSATASRTISTYNDLYVTVYNNADNSCNTTNAGQLEAYVGNGTAPYSYQWSNGQNTAIINNLTNGTYTITVTGANSCTATASRSINTYNDLYVTVYNNADNSCNTTNAGQLEAYVGNGTAPYSYQWSNGQNTAIINNLTNGTYTVTVTGANTCTATASRDISTYNDLYVTVYNNADNSCNTTNAGQLEAYVGNGTAPYSYQWSNGQNTAIINNLPNGTYTVTVTGANTCTATASRDISTYNDLYVTVYNNNDNSCNTTHAGQLEAYVGNGTAPYTYQWYLVQGVTQPEITANNYTLTSTPGVGYQWYLNGQPINNANSQTYTAVTSGNYSVRVTYANGCSATSIVTVITVISGIDDINAATLKLYPNPATDVLTIEGLPGNIATLLQVYDLAGKLLLQQSETNHINVGQLAAGTYILHAGYQTQKKQLRFVKQ